MNITRSLKTAASVAGFVVLVSACGGGGGDSGGVASLANTEQVAASSADDGAGDGATTEEELLAWVECIREEGLDIADPTVDQDGNLVLGGGRGGPPAGGGAADSAERPNREGFSAATEKCGRPPQTGGGFSEEDRQAAQDSMLELAQCLRAAGFDVADPDFSSQGPGGAPRAAETDGGTDSGPRGPFGDLDMDDPAVQAAMTSCQAELGTTFPGGRGPRATTGDND